MSTIRLASVSDAAAIARIYAPHCATGAVSFEEVPPAEDEMAGRIARVGATRPWLVLDDNGSVAGYAYAGPHHERSSYRWSVSTAIYVSDGHRRRGAGSALYTTLFALLADLGYYTATAGITLPNAASVRLHESFGFAPVGVYRHIGYKLGGWHDVGWYQKIIQPPAGRPEEPRPIGSVAGTAAFERAVAAGVSQYVQHP